MTSSKRQWGTERNTTPLPYLHDRPSNNKIALSRLAIVLTIFFWILYIISVIIRQFFVGPATFQFTMEVVFYVVVVSFLTFSALLYLITRQGALQRFQKHVRVPRAVLDKYFSRNEPKLTVLVPSYDEEPSVIRKTLLSAAIQEYPGLRIVLLLDDDPYTKDIKKLARLHETYKLREEIEKLLSKPHKRFEQASIDFQKQSAGKKIVTFKDIKALSSQYSWASTWLRKCADSEQNTDHVDTFFREHVLMDLAKDLLMVKEALLHSHEENILLSKDRVQQLYQRLAWIFEAKIEIFERKRYISLSQDPNKAMNLNSYIGLMGNKYHIEDTPDGQVLVPVTRPRKGDVYFPDSEFILTLDADSILLKDYCLRLVYFLQQPDHSDVAVTQTPYSSFRGAATRIERIAGATTDIQHILHQGMSYYDATFWVGANAVIRKKALEDIAESEWVGGFEVKRYIHDNTVIEDTESSIDLTFHGWRLVNYPERLSYSATPPDFGTLVIQRRRWANGGLLIMPKYWSHLRLKKSRNEHVSQIESFIRQNYMASIAWSSFGLLFLLAYPYDGRLLSPLILLAAMPYFIAMASDLKYCRYSYSDIFLIYGFNLILLPVNLAGILKSIQQALTTTKTAFARTPKVKNRTSAGLPFVVFPLLIISFSLFTLWRDYQAGNWGNAAFAAFNAIAAVWATVAYIGIADLIIDIWLGLVRYLYVDLPVQKSEKIESHERKINWKSVLYHGEENGVLPHNSISNLIIDTRND